jgi:DNA-binding response OmpR family regulator
MISYHKEVRIMRILLAEDEKALSKAIVKIFEKNNYSVDAVYDGEDALAYLEAGCYDVAVLDIMMPKMDGITVLKKARAEGIGIPILMLTAKAEIEDRVLGLDSGANDYLPKPFDSRELLARIRSITRSRTEPDTRLTVGNITLDRATFELSSPTASFRLANKEYQMMEYLMVNPRRIISPEMFMEKIWGYDSEAEINVVWVYISYLRKKLTSLGADIHIKATRNAGYSLETLA